MHFVKIILSISLTFFSVFVVGQSHVNVILIDGYTNLPLDNCAITITKKQKPFVEAKRIIRSMPKWTPAEHKGEKVRVQCLLPFNFVLD